MKILLTLILNLLSVCVIISQEYTFSVMGIVIDAETGKPVEGVSIKVHVENFNAVTDRNGYFRIDSLKAENYVIEFSADGYKPLNLKITPEDRTKLLISIYPLSYRLPVITVTEDHPKSRFDHLSELKTSLRDKELQKKIGQTLAATLRNETGISLRSMGPAPSRPVFRGMTGDRVIITEDGIKTTDLSATSPDHSVTSETFTTDRIEILRGPKLLALSSIASGGLINIVRNEIPQELPGRLNLKLGSYGETNNKGYLVSSVIQLPVNKFVIRGEGSYRNASDITSPTGLLDNTDYSVINTALGFSFVHNKGYTGFSLREYRTKYGIPGGFIGAHPLGVRINMTKRQYNLKFHFNFESDFADHIDVELSRAYYKHSELESPTIIGSEFRIINWQGKFNFYNKSIGLFKNGLAGLSAEYRDFNIGGYVFSPPAKSGNLALYLNQEIEGKNLGIDLSARYDFNIITPRQVVQLGNLDTIYQRKFHTFSLAGSVVFNVNKNLKTGIVLSRSMRVPTIEELYSDGPHLAAYSYEIGNPSLMPEKIYNLECFFFYKTNTMSGYITGFWNYMPDFIIHRNTGRINYQTLLPVYQSTGVKAELIGIEAQAEYNLTQSLSVESSLSYVHGRIKNNGYLPQMPPVKNISIIKYHRTGYQFGITTEAVSAQDKLDQFETRTPGYLLIGAFAQYSLITGKVIHNISINAENLTNRVHYNHLSRIKSIFPEPGINLRLSYKLYY